MTDEKQQVVKIDRPMHRGDLDQIMANIKAPVGAAMVLCCPACQSPELGVAYIGGLVVLTCRACQQAIGSVQVAGDAQLQLDVVLARLTVLRAVIASPAAAATMPWPEVPRG